MFPTNGRELSSTDTRQLPARARRQQTLKRQIQACTFYNSLFKSYKHVVTQRTKQQPRSEREPGKERKQGKYTCRAVML